MSNLRNKKKGSKFENKVQKDYREGEGSCMSYITHGLYLKKYYCHDCDKQLSSPFSIRCRKCSTKYLIETGKIPTGNMLGKKHSLSTKRKISLASKRLWQDTTFRKNNSRPCSEETKRKISLSNMNKKTSETKAKHHIYLKANDSKCIELSYKKHGMLHAKAYDYIYAQYGKKGIDAFLKWFDENYKLYE